MEEILELAYGEHLSKDDFDKGHEMNILMYMDESQGEADFVRYYLNGNEENDSHWRQFLYAIIAYEWKVTIGGNIFHHYVRMLRDSPITQEDFDKIKYCENKEL